MERKLLDMMNQLSISEYNPRMKYCDKLLFMEVYIMRVIISIIPLSLYNGKKSDNEKINKVMKWAFYIYYPLHLLVLGIICLFI